MTQHLYGSQLHDDVVTSAKQGPGQGLDEVSHEDLKLVLVLLEDDWTSGRRRGDKKQGQGLTSLSYVNHTFKTSNMHKLFTKNWPNFFRLSRLASRNLPKPQPAEKSGLAGFKPQFS